MVTHLPLQRSKADSRQSLPFLRQAPVDRDIPPRAVYERHLHDPAARRYGRGYQQILVIETFLLIELMKHDTSQADGALAGFTWIWGLNSATNV